MRRFQWFSSFIIIALLITSCGPVDAKLSVDQPIVQSLDLEPAGPAQAVSTPEATAEAETNECLKCHMDKQLLIDTADPVEAIAESESKGVG